MKKDEKGGGTNTDGSKSTMYCSHCYENGKFTLPDITVDQMKERVKQKLKEFGFPDFWLACLPKTFLSWSVGGSRKFIRLFVHSFRSKYERINE